ncbi:YbaK/EbsC family protein [Martelella alba]|uniref:YbaK/EbsC family protein n=1 Tax=Martelella alba TaxID=2590451 RepID=A0A506UIY1_9HYPH|nr:YbaK/EbsC family protein [Martelella alba]TPW33270.1 YbaK/EbsC family protein [Martelella alba]
MSDAGGKRASIDRVRDEAAEKRLDITILTMDQSTRTAEDAANAAGCAVGQIVKSLIFNDKNSGGLVLILVSGAHNADLAHLQSVYGLSLDCADAKRVRAETGFAIGGVAPIGHLVPLPVYMDEALFIHDVVWCAAGRPDSIFSVAPDALAEAVAAQRLTVR